MSAGDHRTDVSRHGITFARLTKNFGLQKRFWIVCISKMCCSELGYSLHHAPVMYQEEESVVFSVIINSLKKVRCCGVKHSRTSCMMNLNRRGNKRREKNFKKGARI